MLLSVSLWNDLNDPVCDGGAEGFYEQSQCLLAGLICCLLLSFTIFSFFPSMGRVCGVGVFGLIVFSLSPSLALPTHFLILIIIKYFDGI